MPDDFRSDHLTVLENGVEQKVQAVRTAVSRSTAIVLDTSGSMIGSISEPQWSMVLPAVPAFLESRDPSDEFCLITTGDHPSVAIDFTSDVRLIAAQLTPLEPRGRTALYDGVYLALNLLERAKNDRKSVLVITDGGETTSVYLEREILKAAEQGHTQIFVLVALQANRQSLPEARDSVAFFDRLARRTGGFCITAPVAKDFAQKAAALGYLLRRQIDLVYAPTNPARDGKWRKTEVRLRKTKANRKLKVFTRSGYYAPASGP